MAQAVDHAPPFHKGVSTIMGVGDSPGEPGLERIIRRAAGAGAVAGGLAAGAAHAAGDQERAARALGFTVAFAFAHLAARLPGR